MSISRLSPVTWLLALLAVVGSFGLLADQRDVSADHPYSPVRHIWTEHPGPPSEEPDEDWCTNTVNSTMGHSTAQTKVRKTLMEDAPAQDWHGAAGGLIYFDEHATPCNAMDAEERAGIEFRYKIYDDTDALCNGVSCQMRFGLMTNTDHDDGLDYTYAELYIKQAHITGTQAAMHHVISHETGHDLGLCDGGDNPP